MFLRAIKLTLPCMRQYASFTLRDILTENSRQTGTLFLKFAKHLALESRTTLNDVPTKIRYADFFPVTDLRQFERELQRIEADQLAALITFAYTNRANANPATFAEILNKLDAQALKLLPKMNDDVILNTLYSLLFLMPSWMNLMDFHKTGTHKLAEQYLTQGGATKDKFVQLIFYLGLNKKNVSGTQMQKLLNQQLQAHLPQMTSMDLAIICNASYKVAISVDCDEFNARLQQEILKLEPEAPQMELLITYLKSMRLQKQKNAQICKHLAKYCAQPSALKQMPVSGLTHLFAVFAENLWDNPECTEPVISTFLSHISESTNVEGSLNKFRSALASTELRAKDLDKFLWCCAQLNCNLSKPVLERMEQALLQKVRNEEFNMFPDQLVDSVLSLWILGYKSKSLYEQANLLKTQATIKRHQPKVDARLTVLQTAVGIEEPQWLSGKSQTTPFNLENKAPAYILKNHGLMLEVAQKLSEEAEVVETSMVCPIVGINIPSIAVSLKHRTVLVELLNADQTLQFSKEATSTMRLKIHLLKSLEQTVIVVREQESLNIADIKQLILAQVDDKTQLDTIRNRG